jgi:tryptophan 2,3-dioxygenase
MPSPSSLPIALAEHGCPAGGTSAQPAGPGCAPYRDYVGVDTLQALQRPKTDQPAELLFLTITQVQELMLSFLVKEVGRARDHLFLGDVDGALWQLRRIVSAQQVLLSTWEPLNTMSAPEYLDFRDALGDASGFQSATFRLFEFSLGRKSPHLTEFYRDVPAVHRQLEDALMAPSLYDAAIHLLRRRNVLTTATTDGHPLPEEVEQAWAAVYRDPDRDRSLFLLAESLSDVAAQFVRWRSEHVLVVERVLGAKTGTAGTSGLDWLRRSADHRFFPELWAARSCL